jgi:superfamily II DNA or RNA helicase
MESSAGTPDWMLYEHQMVERHAAEHPDAEVYHWTHVPEPMLEASGYIHDRNQWRLERKRKHEDPNPLSDYGLDGMARVGPDEFHGLQAKRRKAGSYLRAADLGSFQMVVGRLRAKFPKSRGIVYTDARLTRELADDVELLGDSYSVVHMPLEATAPPKPAVAPVDLVPWPHQVEALEALAEWDGSRGALVMPCGSGKTAVMGLHGRRFARVVVLSPTRVLARQTLERMQQLMPEHVGLLVDSDQQGTRDVEEIRAAWAADKVLISATYASIDVLALAGLSADDAVLFVDEAHHLAENSELRAAVDQVPCPAVLTTATPPEALTDDPEDVIYQYDYDRAVRDGRICDFKLYFPVVLAGPTLQDDADHKVLVQELDESLVARCHFLANGMLRTGATRCIVYAGTCAEAAAYADAIVRLASQFHGIDASAATITGETPPAQRDALLREFQTDGPRWRFLCSVRVLDEGVDIPGCDAVYITRCTDRSSKVRFVQRLCRANRLGYHGKMANVFVWTDEDGMDDTIKCAVQTMTYLDSTPGTWRRRIGLVQTDYDALGSADALDAQLAPFIDHASTLCVTGSEKWAMRFADFQAVVVASDRLPSQSHCADEKRMEAWWRNQRNFYRQQRYTVWNDKSARAKWELFLREHCDLLISHADMWRKTRDQTIAFMEGVGRRPQYGADDAEEHRLAIWCRNQTGAYSDDVDQCTRIMKDPCVRNEWLQLCTRYPALSGVETWRQMRNQTDTFMLVNGRRPTAKCEKKLATWLTSQIHRYSDDLANCTGIMRNESIRFEWRQFREKHAEMLLPACDIWYQTHDKVVEFATNGRMPSRSKKAPDEEQILARWIGTQRSTARRGVMLESVRGAWAQFCTDHADLMLSGSDLWHHRLAETVRSAALNGRMPRQTAECAVERKLGIWLANAKKRCSDDPTECTHIMRDVGVQSAWRAFCAEHAHMLMSDAQRWWLNYSKLKAFVELNGRMPSHIAQHTEERKLGVWANSQKKNYLQDLAKCKGAMRDKKIQHAWAAFCNEMLPSKKK